MQCGSATSSDPHLRTGDCVRVGNTEVTELTEVTENEESLTLSSDNSSSLQTAVNDGCSRNCEVHSTDVLSSL